MPTHGSAQSTRRRPQLHLPVQYGCGHNDYQAPERLLPSGLLGSRYCQRNQYVLLGAAFQLHLATWIGFMEDNDYVVRMSSYGVSTEDTNDTNRNHYLLDSTVG